MYALSLRAADGSTHVTFASEARFPPVARKDKAHAAPTMDIRKDISLARHTTMRLGGPARFFAEAKSKKDLLTAAIAAKKGHLPIFILGEGSNILVSDKGLDAFVVKNSLRGIFFKNAASRVRAVAAGGENWDRFVGLCVLRNLTGIENLSLIPGTVGATPVQNIGAYGQEVSETIEWVEVFDVETERFVKLTNKECAFRYRESIFKNKKQNHIITRVSFLLSENGPPATGYKDVAAYLKEHRFIAPTVSDMRRAVIAIRQAKLPDPQKVGTIGSFFKNPIVAKERHRDLLRDHPGLPGYEAENGVKIPLGWVIENLCKYKGVRRGPVGVYPKQALVLVHYGGGTAQGIFNFSEEIRSCVKEKIGVMPKYEISFEGVF